MVNGQNVKSQSRADIIKLGSERFKKEYAESLVNSFESKYVVTTLLG